MMFLTSQGRQAEGLNHSSRGQHTRVRPRNGGLMLSSRPVRALQFTLSIPKLFQPIEGYPRLLKGILKNIFFPAHPSIPIFAAAFWTPLVGYGRHSSRLGIGEKNLFRASGTKVARRPSERARVNGRLRTAPPGGSIYRPLPCRSQWPGRPRPFPSRQLA